MAIAIVFNSDGSMCSGAIRNEMTIDRLKKIKEVKGRSCLKITSEQADEIDKGWLASNAGGIVSVIEPDGWLDNYKAKKIAEQKRSGIKVFKDFQDDFANQNSAIPTKRFAMDNYFKNTVEKNINLAADKDAVDSTVNGLNWSSV